MNLTLLVVLLSGSTVFLQAPGGSRCKCATSQASTREGANENIVLVEREKHHRLEGIVRTVNGETLPGVLVEVFNKPEYLLLSYPESEEKKKGQKRLRRQKFVSAIPRQTLPPLSHTGAGHAFP